MILDGREPELGDIIVKCEGEGMIPYNSSLAELVNKEYVHPKTALEAARNPEELKMRLKGIRTGVAK
jgi:twitching motility protein PilT